MGSDHVARGAPDVEIHCQATKGDTIHVILVLGMRRAPARRQLTAGTVQPVRGRHFRRADISVSPANTHVRTIKGISPSPKSHAHPPPHSRWPHGGSVWKPLRLLVQIVRFVANSNHQRLLSSYVDLKAGHDCF